MQKKIARVFQTSLMLLCVVGAADSFAAGTWNVLPDFGLSERSEAQISVGDGQVFLYGGVGPNISGGSAFHLETFKDGVLFNLKKESWRPLPPAPVSHGVAAAASLWTGQEFVTLGGYHWREGVRCGPSPSSRSCYARSNPTDSSAFFDPKLFTWRAYPYSSSVSPNALHFDKSTNQLLRKVEQETDDEIAMMISMQDLNRFQSNFTSAVSLKEVGSVTAYASGWHQGRREFIIWGGSSRSGGSKYNSGFIYSATSNRWRSMPAPPRGFAGRQGMAHALIGNKFIIWGGYNRYVSGENLSDGAMFDLVTNKWTRMSPAPIGPRENPSFASNGKRLFIGFGYLISADLIKARQTTTDPDKLEALRLSGRRMYPAAESADAAIFDPNSNTWEKIPDPPLSAARLSPAVAWYEDKIFFWGGQGSGLSNGDRYFGDGAVYTVDQKKTEN